MLQNQNSVLVTHAQIMGENQEVLKNLIKTQTKRNLKTELESNKVVIQEMMKPLQVQLDEIKRFYDETKSCANEVNKALNTVKQGHKLDLDTKPEAEKDFLDKFGNYMNNNQKLREKVNEADNLTKVYKEKFKNLETFDMQIYLKNLNQLNNQLKDLEQRSVKGQDELEKRIEGVNKKYNLILPATYLDILQQNLDGINLLKRKSVGHFNEGPGGQARG